MSDSLVRAMSYVSISPGVPLSLLMEIAQCKQAMVTARIWPNLPILKEHQEAAACTELQENNLCLLD